jgi:hypothetical protein
MSEEQTQNATFDTQLNEQLVRNARTNWNWNVEQEMIIITEDKLKLCILKHISAVTEQAGWIAPVSLFATFVTVLATADFRQFVFPAATWHAVFVICTLITGLWSAQAVWRAWGTPANIDTLVRDIKKTAKADGA